MGEHPVLARCKLTSLSAQTHSRPKLGLGICRHGHAAVSARVHALLTQARLLVIMPALPSAPVLANEIAATFYATLMALPHLPRASVGAGHPR
jgi:hypothetical protein